MKVIPAIDLLDGKVVRLKKGDPNLSTIYSDDPLGMAKEWQDEGAEILHLVDLSAAFDQGDNSVIIEEITKNIDIPVQAGGGIRTVEKAKRLISAGVTRIVVGTKSTDEAFLDSLLNEVGPERLAVGLDLMGGNLAIQGWRTTTDIKGVEFVNYLKGKGIEWIIHTDISRDGTLEGPNLEEVQSFASLGGMNIIASGGVSSLEDLKKLRAKAPSLWGVIVGKALYEGKFTVSEAKAIL
jgi:phosphoribosylformimino-5-aminoimidazole carboxamide ribotide isomerase